MSEGWGVASLVPLVVTLILAFVTRSALGAMLAGTFVGTLMLGSAPGAGLNDLFQTALGNGEFIWIAEIVILIGIMFALFARSGVLHALAARFSGTSGSRRKVEMSAWGMGFLIVDDYFSPLLSGAVIRPVSDKAGVPREKLAFILDSTTASVCILVPFTAWGAYVASLIAAQSPAIETPDEALAVFIGAIQYNFYPMLMLAFSLLVCAKLIPDFGPMRNAERRVAETGQLLRPGAKPLVTDDAFETNPSSSTRGASLVRDLLVPVVLLFTVGTWSIVVFGSVKIVEAFMLADTWLFLSLAVRGELSSIEEAAELITDGAKAVMPALLIVALAYALNAVTTQLGAGHYVAQQFTGDIPNNILVLIIFLTTATIAFATGTSWGAFAIMMPVALPVAWGIAGGTLEPIVYQAVAAIAGGGIFGDHASPVSDTTVLSSVGAGSDHIDHVVTQLPYALSMAIVTSALYLLL